MMIININKNAFTKKTYTIFMMSFKTSDKKTYFSFFYIVISHIMFSDESENKSFWNQVIFQNIREKNL